MTSYYQTQKVIVTFGGSQLSGGSNFREVATLRGVATFGGVVTFGGRNFWRVATLRATLILEGHNFEGVATFGGSQL